MPLPRPGRRVLAAGLGLTALLLADQGLLPGPASAPAAPPLALSEPEPGPPDSALAAADRAPNPRTEADPVAPPPADPTPVPGPLALDRNPFAIQLFSLRRPRASHPSSNVMPLPARCLLATRQRVRSGMVCLRGDYASQAEARAPWPPRPPPCGAWGPDPAGSRLFPVPAAR